MRRLKLQTKIGISYMTIILAVLLLLNTYPLIVSQNLVFRSKQSAMQSSVSVMVTALSGTAELTGENVSTAMTLVEETGISRILVADEMGQILYDTRETDSAVGRYGLYTELVQALHGLDVFHSCFQDGAFESRAASPVIYQSRTIGAVYAYEYDAEQAVLLLELQKNLMRISVLVMVFAAGLSGWFTRVMTRRFSNLLGAIRRIRDGAYDYRAESSGHDEISNIATEFNSLSERLQKTEDARRRFVADASHELKTPLAGIRLLSDSILQTENIDSATAREFVEDIKQETDRLTRITENLLKLTRLDSGAQLTVAPTDAAKVLEHVVRMLRPVAEEKKVAISYEVVRPVTVLLNADDLHQVVYNLAENAVKYNRTGGFVHISLDVEEEQCVICVADNGIGIRDEDIPHVFERFYRVDKARSRAAGGSGLGLSIAADTVHRCGGTIEAGHREGGGTLFTVCLPLCEEEGEA